VASVTWLTSEPRPLDSSTGPPNHDMVRNYIREGPPRLHAPKGKARPDTRICVTPKFGLLSRQDKDWVAWANQPLTTIPLLLPPSLSLGNTWRPYLLHSSLGLMTGLHGGWPWKGHPALRGPALLSGSDYRCMVPLTVKGRLQGAAEF